MEPRIKVKNKKTGQMFEGTVEEARQYGFSDEFINKKLKASIELEKNIKTLKEGGDITATETVGKITAKDKALAESGLAAVKQVANIYEKDPGVLSKQLIPGQFASREFDNAVYNMADTLLRLRTGAQANPSEIKGYMKKIAPSFGDNPEVVQRKLNNLQRDLSIYVGKKPEELGQIKISSQAEQVPQRGIGLPGPIEYLKRSFRGELAAQKEPLTGIQQASQIAGPLGLLLSGRPDIFQETGSAAVQTLALLKLLGGGGISGGGISKKILNPRGALKQKEIGEAAKAIGQVKTNKLVDTAKKYIDIDPEAEVILNKQMPSIQKTKTASDLLDRLDVWKRAYTSAGKAGKTPRAGLFKALYEEGLKQLAEVAPKAKKIRNIERLTYTLPKNIAKGTWLAAKLGLGKIGLGL